MKSSQLQVQFVFYSNGSPPTARLPSDRPSFMSIVVFEDPQCELLAPITIARLAAAVTCGSFRLVDLLEPMGSEVFGISRPHLQTLQRIDFPSLRMLDDSSNDGQPERRIRLLLNARVAPTKQNFEQIQVLHRLAHVASSGSSPMVIWDREHVAAVVNPPWTVEQLFHIGYLGVEEWLEKAKAFERYECKLGTIAVPHEIVACNMACIRDSLEWRIQLGANSAEGRSGTPKVSELRQLSDGLFLANGASVGEYVLTDTRKGPIVIDSGAQIGPYTLLRGPIYIGKGGTHSGTFGDQRRSVAFPHNQNWWRSGSIHCRTLQQ